MEWIGPLVTRRACVIVFLSLRSATDLAFACLHLSVHGCAHQEWLLQFFVLFHHRTCFSVSSCVALVMVFVLYQVRRSVGCRAWHSCWNYQSYPKPGLKIKRTVRIKIITFQFVRNALRQSGQTFKLYLIVMQIMSFSALCMAFLYSQCVPFSTDCPMTHTESFAAFRHVRARSHTHSTFNNLHKRGSFHVVVVHVQATNCLV